MAQNPEIFTFSEQFDFEDDPQLRADKLNAFTKDIERWIQENLDVEEWTIPESRIAWDAINGHNHDARVSRHIRWEEPIADEVLIDGDNSVGWTIFNEDIDYDAIHILGPASDYGTVFRIGYTDGSTATETMAFNADGSLALSSTLTTTKLISPELEYTGNITIDAYNSSDTSTVYILNSDEAQGCILNIETSIFTPLVSTTDIIATGDVGIAGTLTVDTINEKTTDHGVDIETVHLENGEIFASKFGYASGSFSIDAQAVGSQTTITVENSTAGAVVGGEVILDLYGDLHIYGTEVIQRTMAGANNIVGVTDITAGGNIAATGNVTGANLNISNWNDAYTHVTSNGTDHGYIDQDVQTTAGPTFATLLIASANPYVDIYDASATGVSQLKLRNSDQTWELRCNGATADELSFVDTTNSNTEVIRVFKQSYQDSLAIGTSEITINQSGNDVDFRVEGASEAHAIFLEASSNRVGINNSSPSYTLDVTGEVNASTAFRVGGTIGLTTTVLVSNGDGG